MGVNPPLLYILTSDVTQAMLPQNCFVEMHNVEVNGPIDPEHRCFLRIALQVQTFWFNNLPLHLSRMPWPGHLDTGVLHSAPTKEQEFLGHFKVATSREKNRVVPSSYLFGNPGESSIP